MILTKKIKLILAGVAALGIVVATYNVTSFIEQKKFQAKLDSQQKTLIDKCNRDKKITYEVSNEYQAKISTLNARINELKRLSDNICVPITNTASGYNAETEKGYDNGNEIPAGKLYDYAGQAEQYRQQLIGCQSFIIKTWENQE